MLDFYKVLGLEKTATKEDIKKAYYKLSQKHHPDKGGKEEEFHKIALAYEVLSDEDKRGKYDRGEPVFETHDPEAFIRNRALSLFEQQVNNPNFDYKHKNVFEIVGLQIKQLIDNAPNAEKNARNMIRVLSGVRDRIEGDNTEIYLNSLNTKIKMYENMIKGIPQEIENMEKIRDYIKKTKYRTDKRSTQRQTSFHNSGATSYFLG